MKKSYLALGVIAFSSAAGLAAQVSVNDHKENFDDWKNRPTSEFSDAQANFEAAKKMLLAKYYDPKLSDAALYEAATRGMLESLNPNEKDEWNKLYSPAELKEFQSDAAGEVTGIGIGLEFHDETGTATINGLEAKTPAEKAQLKPGDQLVSIDGKICQGMQFRDIVYAIRGKAGEPVKLKVLRGDELITKKIIREKLSWSSIESSVLDHGITLIRINYFNEKSSRDLKTALLNANSRHTKGIILDLRFNEGGLFDQAVQSAELFTPKGKTIVTVRSRGGKDVKVNTANNDAIINGVPITILVSGKTSSGAELFAGSLRDNLGAKLIGEKTHGKWTAQTIETLPNGFAIKFTQSLFEIPNGNPKNDEGLTPDISATKSKGNDEQLKTAVELLSSKN